MVNIYESIHELKQEIDKKASEDILTIDQLNSYNKRLDALKDKAHECQEALKDIQRRKEMDNLS